MGTSSIYNGPKDNNSNNPLLPDDYDEINPQKPWQAAKNSMSRYVSGTSGNSIGAIRNHTKASGGANEITKSATSGRLSTIKLGSFLQSVANQGVQRTLDNLHIDYEGISIEEVLSNLVNVISEKSETKEDSVARDATTEALFVLYESIEEANDFTQLDSMGKDFFEIMLEQYISSYIWGRILNDLAKSFDKNTKDISSSIIKENDFKEYIKNSVHVELEKHDISDIDFNSENINKIVFTIYEDCYKSLETL